MKMMKMAVLKIGTRLRLGFALVLALLVIVTVLGLRHMAQMQERIDEITSVNNVKTQLATAHDRPAELPSAAVQTMPLLASE